MNHALDTDWRKPYLARAWDVALASTRKKAEKDAKRTTLPSQADFRYEAQVVWGELIGQCVYDFWCGIHCLCTIWDGNPETEEEAFDDKGQPWTFYDEGFITRLCALAAEYGLYKNAAEARLYVSLWDRYCERGRWVLETLQAMLLELPTLPGETVDAYWRYRSGLPADYDPASPQMILPLFA